MSRTQPYVFISYSSKDYWFTDWLVQYLDSIGVAYWKAPEMIPAGSSYAKEIYGAIRGCSIFLVVISENSQNSIWVEKEIDSALSLDREIIPLLIDDVPMKDTFRFYLNNVQMIPYVENSEASLAELRGKLAPFSIYDLSTLDNQNTYTEVEEAQISIEESSELAARASAAESVMRAYGRGTASVKGRTAGSTQKRGQAKQTTQAGVRKTGTKVGQNTTRIPVREVQALAKDVYDGPVGANPARGMKRRDPMSHNRVPTLCVKCGGFMRNMQGGVFRCTKCGKEDYDDFRTIKNYIREHGARSIEALEKELGIPKRVIKEFRDMGLG